MMKMIVSSNNINGSKSKWLFSMIKALYIYPEFLQIMLWVQWENSPIVHMGFDTINQYSL